MIIQIPSAHTSKYDKLVNVWEQMYWRRYAGNKKQMRVRLKELQTWDKPINPVDNDPHGRHKEHAAKIEALKNLTKQ